MHSSIHVSVASSRPDPGEDADSTTGRTHSPPRPPPPPRPPVLPRGYPTTFRVRLFRADRPGDSRSVTLDDPRSVSPRLFFERLEPSASASATSSDPACGNNGTSAVTSDGLRDARAKRAFPPREASFPSRPRPPPPPPPPRAPTRPHARPAASTGRRCETRSDAPIPRPNVSRSRLSDGATPGAFPTRSRNVTAMCARHIRAGNVAAEDSAATAPAR